MRCPPQLSRSRKALGAMAMTDNLTQMLHSLSEQLPVQQRSPAQLRSLADRGHRIRRGIGGAAVCGAAVAVIISSGVIATNARSPLPAAGPLRPSQYELSIARDRNILIILESSVPADAPPTRMELAFLTATPDGPASTTASALLDLTVDATLTDTDLEKFRRQAVRSIGPWMRLPSESPPPELNQCLPVPADLGASELQDATFVAADEAAEYDGPEPLPQARMNEFVLKFESEPAAAAAYDAARRDAMNCSEDELAFLSMDASAPIDRSQRPVEATYIPLFTRSK